METTVRYRTFLIRPMVTVEANGRYPASAVITDLNNEKLTNDPLHLQEFNLE